MTGWGLGMSCLVWREFRGIESSSGSWGWGWEGGEVQGRRKGGGGGGSRGSDDPPPPLFGGKFYTFPI